MNEKTSSATSFLIFTTHPLRLDYSEGAQESACGDEEENCVLYASFPPTTFLWSTIHKEKCREKMERMRAWKGEHWTEDEDSEELWTRVLLYVWKI